MPRRKTSRPKKKPTAFDLVLAERERQRREANEQAIEEFLAWTKEHPSVHDRMPRDGR